MIVLGMLVGPHAPTIGIFDFKFIDSQGIIDFLGQIGILFLLFYLGLEFSVQKLIKSGRNIVVGGTVYVTLNFALGLAYGFIVQMPLYETLIIAGMLSVSSSAIVAKVLVDLRRTGNSETELILGMILFDDIFLAVFLSIMSGLLLGGATSIGATLLSVCISIGYMLLFFVIARKGPPLLNKWLRITSNEIFIIVVFSVMFLLLASRRNCTWPRQSARFSLAWRSRNGAWRTHRAAGRAIPRFLRRCLLLQLRAEH